MHLGRARAWPHGSRLQFDPIARIFADGLRPALLGKPASPVEICKSNAAPVHILRQGGIAFYADAHHHRITLLDFANLSQFGFVAEAGDKPGPQIKPGKITDAETGKDYENQ